MNRTSRRITVVATMAGLILGLLGTAPALAKGGPNEEAIGEGSGVALITLIGGGASRSSPTYQASWRGDCGPPYQCEDAFKRPDEPLLTLLYDGGVVGAVARTRNYYGAPDPAKLGPGYRVEYYVTVGGFRPVRAVQDMYPSGPGGRTWFYTPPGQSAFGNRLIAGWVQAPASLRDTLIAIGIPTSLPSAGLPLQAPNHIERAPRPVWVVAVVAALLGLVIGSGLALRPRRASRAAGAA